MQRTTRLAALLGLLAAGSALAQEQHDPYSRPGGAELRVELPRELLFDRRGPDELWALGNTYKMGFDAGGATFVPFLGSHAPRNFPVRFRVASVRAGEAAVPFDAGALPQWAGAGHERVAFDRGSLVELYDLGLESAEQSFLFRERPAGGALAIELTVETELERGTDAQGLVFRGQHGSVHYSSAIAIDARGERVAAPTRLEGDRIRIEVPAAELDRLEFPLLVDPVISTFSLQPNSVYGEYPDVVYDAEHGLWCVAYEFVFSATDSDVLTLRLDSDGDIVINGTVDISNVSWTQPKIASNRRASQVLVVAAAGPSGSRRIQGRTQDGLTSATGPVILISPAGGDCILPDVGGDGSTNLLTYYCVVWARVNGSSDTDVRGQMVRTDSTLSGSALQIAGPIGTVETLPAISHSNGTGADRSWTVAWQRYALFDSDLYAARISANGTIVNSAFALDTTVNDTRYASVSSPTDDGYVMIAYMRGSVGDADTSCYVLQDGVYQGGANLTFFTGAHPNENHLYPSVDSDGEVFVYVEAESFPSSTLYGLFASTMDWVDGQLVLLEGHQSMGVSGSSGPLPEVACAGSSGGPDKLACLVWHYEGFAPEPTLFGGFYAASPFSSLCAPASPGIVDCPCGNTPSGPGRGCDNSSQTGGAMLTPSGDVQPDSLVLTASDMTTNAVCLLVQTNATQAPVVFGDGIRCATGNVKRMGVRHSVLGEAIWPGPGEPSISAKSASLGDPIAPGTARYYYVYYRDTSPNWACVPTFNLTQTVQVRW